jgi:hypothetical protein
MADDGHLEFQSAHHNFETIEHTYTKFGRYIKVEDRNIVHHRWFDKPYPIWQTAAILNSIQHSITLEPFNVHIPNLTVILSSMVGTL